jgi:uncharacterized membrane protein
MKFILSFLLALPAVHILNTYDISLVKTPFDFLIIIISISASLAAHLVDLK